MRGRQRAVIERHTTRRNMPLKANTVPTREAKLHNSILHLGSTTQGTLCECPGASRTGLKRKRVKHQRHRDSGEPSHREGVQFYQGSPGPSKAASQQLPDPYVTRSVTSRPPQALLVRSYSIHR